MKDFTFLGYSYFLDTLIYKGYVFQTLIDFNKLNKKFLILRHDIDTFAENSLIIAQIENEKRISGTYYFRIVPQSNHPKIIEKIATLGHEIGYHYEDLALCKGIMDEAIRSFEKNLKYFRQFYPVKTICMHGSPLSKYDNRKLWEKYDYRDFGIEAEPYFDVDYTKVLYLTDTGRRWDGEAYSVRDKVMNLSAKSSKSTKSSGSEDKKTEQATISPGDQKTMEDWRGDKWDNGPLDKNKKMVSRDKNGILIHNFHSTFDIIRAAEENQLPDQIMITVHPQRWTNNPILWTKELVMQNVKNQVKRVIVKRG